jgi:hypothetical protein
MVDSKILIAPSALSTLDLGVAAAGLGVAAADVSCLVDIVVVGFGVDVIARKMMLLRICINYKCDGDEK